MIYITIWRGTNISTPLPTHLPTYLATTPPNLSCQNTYQTTLPPHLPTYHATIPANLPCQKSLGLLISLQLPLSRGKCDTLLCATAGKQTRLHLLFSLDKLLPPLTGPASGIGSPSAGGRCISSYSLSRLPSSLNITLLETFFMLHRNTNTLQKVVKLALIYATLKYSHCPTKTIKLNVE